MRNRKHIYSSIAFIIFTLLFIASATERNYYQVYKAVPENGKLKDNQITYEDANCKVSYHLWKEGGDIGFNISNKSSTDLTVNIDKSFFVLNGVAHAYYQNRVITKTTNVSSNVSYNYYPYWYYNTTKSQGATSSSSLAVAHNERPTMIIPSLTSMNLSEFRIVDQFYSSCDLFSYPHAANVKALAFDRSTSPYVFYNIISYSIRDSTKTMENSFYVSQIKNIPESEMFDEIYPENCGKKSITPIRVVKESAPNQFYIEYVRQ